MIIKWAHLMSRHRRSNATSEGLAVKHPTHTAPHTSRTEFSDSRSTSIGGMRVVHPFTFFLRQGGRVDRSGGVKQRSVQSERGPCPRSDQPRGNTHQETRGIRMHPMIGVHPKIFQGSSSLQDMSMHLLSHPTPGAIP